MLLGSADSDASEKAFQLEIQCLVDLNPSVPIAEADGMASEFQRNLANVLNEATFLFECFVVAVLAHHQDERTPKTEISDVRQTFELALMPSRLSDDFKLLDQLLVDLMSVLLRWYLACDVAEIPACNAADRYLLDEAGDGSRLACVLH